MAQNDTHDALIILRFVSWGNFVFQKKFFRAALRRRWRVIIISSVFRLATLNWPFTRAPPPPALFPQGLEPDPPPPCAQTFFHASQRLVHDKRRHIRVALVLLQTCCTATLMQFIPWAHAMHNMSSTGTILTTIPQPSVSPSPERSPPRGISCCKFGQPWVSMVRKYVKMSHTAVCEVPERQETGSGTDSFVLTEVLFVVQTAHQM